MGRVVLAEKTTCEPVVNELFRVPVNEEKTGLLIGRLGDETVQKDHVIHLAPTPDDEDGEDNDRKSRVSWVSAHAKQVIRMLPGGVNIVGMTIACVSSNFTELKPDIVKILSQIHKISGRSILQVSETNCRQEYLVLHVCTKTKKVSCQSVSLMDKSPSFQPAEWKVQQFVQQWSKLQTMCNVDLPSLNSLPEGKQQTYLKIQSGLSNIVRSIIDSTTTIDGAIIDDSLAVSSLLGKSTSGKGKKSTSLSTGGNFHVDLYLTPAVFDDSNSAADQTFILYSGCIEGLAFIPSKCSVKDAVLALKLDIIRSIVGRFRILYEDVLESNDEPLAGCLLPPKRITTVTDTSTYTDYVFESETDQDIANRFQEILGIGSDTDSVINSNECFQDEDILGKISMPKSRPSASSVVEEITGGIRAKAATGLILAGAAALASIFVGKMVME